LLGKVAIAVLTTWISYYFVPAGLHVQSQCALVCIIFVLAFVVAQLFLGIYGASSESILINTLIHKDLGLNFSQTNLHQDLRFALGGLGQDQHSNVGVSGGGHAGIGGHY